MWKIEKLKRVYQVMNSILMYIFLSLARLIESPQNIKRTILLFRVTFIKENKWRIPSIFNIIIYKIYFFSLWGI